MQTKLIEVRDRMTTISALAVQISGQEKRKTYALGIKWKTIENDGWLVRRIGIRDPIVVLTNLGSGECCLDPIGWKDRRTMPVVHQYLLDHWDDTESNAVVDVEFILKETDHPKQSDRP